MAAAALKTPELQLDDKEAKLLAQSAAEVASHYNVEIDPKVMAWIGFFGVCGSIYGPRIAAMKIRKDMERREARKQANPTPPPMPHEFEQVQSDPFVSIPPPMLN